MKKALSALLVVATTIGSAGGVTLITGVLAGAQATSGADLAQQYLAALGPAGSAIAAAEAKLKTLPVTATVAQVEADVAPLPKALGPLDALTKAGAPSVATGATSLEALGKPNVVAAGGVTCNGYGTSASGAHLVVGSTQYQHGFQMTAPGTCIENYAGYTWPIPTKYTHFSAHVGYDLSDATTCTEVIVRFLGNAGEKLPFTSGGQITEGMVLPAKGLASVTVDLSKQQVLTVQLNWTAARCGVGSNSAVDVVNDQLS